MASRYHPGEIEVQARAGVREMAARISDVIRPEIPLYTRDFLEDQRTVVVGFTGAGGRVWASLLTGEPGFLRVIDERTLRIDACPVPGDPLDENSKPGMDVGLISIDLSSRRRTLPTNSVALSARRTRFSSPVPTPTAPTPRTAVACLASFGY